MEHEFMLLSQTAPEPVYVNNADWSCAAKFRTGSVESVVLEEIAGCLVEAGIELQQYHAEAAPGQVSEADVECSAQHCYVLKSPLGRV